MWAQAVPCPGVLAFDPSVDMEPKDGVGMTFKPHVDSILRAEASLALILWPWTLCYSLPPRGTWISKKWWGVDLSALSAS